jgi:uncharacterized membrane protein YidH (DUF202 family)
MRRLTQLFIPSHPFEWKDGPFWAWLKTALVLLVLSPLALWPYHITLSHIISYYIMSNHLYNIYDITGVVSRNWNPQLSKPPLGRQLPWRLGVKNAQDGNLPYTFCKISVMAAWNQMQWPWARPPRTKWQGRTRDDLPCPTRKWSFLWAVVLLIITVCYIC